MFKIVRNNNDLEGLYETEMEAYQAMSVMADKENKHDQPLWVSFPEQIVVHDASDKITDIFRVVNLHRPNREKNLRISSQSMSIEEILRLLDFGLGDTLLKGCKPPTDQRYDTWLATTDAGTRAYLKLLDILYSLEWITGEDVRPIIDKLDAAIDEIPVVDENMDDDLWKMVEDAPSVKEIHRLEHVVLGSKLEPANKDALLTYCAERLECFK